MGCGSGWECLKLVNRGHEVVGIDTDFKLTELANQWAGYFGLPFKAICMDTMAPGFARKSFDGFLLEIYGSQPLWSQTLALHRNLSGIMRNEGMGFIVAYRKKYESFMRTDYLPSMTMWLRKQSALDYCFTEPDACEERLMYGLYTRSHMQESLSDELKCTFDVVECAYEAHDPRHVMAVVKRKDGRDFAMQAAKQGDLEQTERRCLHLSKGSVRGILGKVESICDMLESHESCVSQFFAYDDCCRRKRHIISIDEELSRFMELLRDAFDVLVESADRRRNNTA